jgi:hypothetical protein
MVAPTITDPFFRQLYNRLAEEIDSRVNACASGAALTFTVNGGVDTTATAMNYQKAVSYIEALQAVIELGIELDHDRYGNRAKESGDE